MQGVFLTILFILGACFGSFLCCEARRLHLKESKKSSKLGRRSVCLKCKYQLKWYDNLPIISWLMLKGKCRKCGKKIGLAEILSELGVGLAFLCIGLKPFIEGLTWQQFLAQPPTAHILFIILLIFVLLLSFLAIYDGIYGELPVPLLTFSVICAIIILLLNEWTILSVSPFSFEIILAPFFSVLILGGLYLVLYLISKGKWVGDGDWILGLAIGLALFHPWYALITLFLSNFLACLVMLPQLKGKRTHKIHFGPFLVIAFVLTTTFADFCISML